MSTPPPPGVPAQEEYTHTGHRFILGFGSDYYGIWDRSAPGPPVRRYAKTTEGWAEAWREYSGWEPENAPLGGPGYTAAGAPAANGRATAAMVCGIVGLLFGPVAIVALVLGLSARAQIDRSGGQQTGRGNAIAGIVMGGIGIVGWVIWIVYVADRVSELT